MTDGFARLIQIAFSTMILVPAAILFGVVVLIAGLVHLVRYWKR